MYDCSPGIGFLLYLLLLDHSVVYGLYLVGGFALYSIAQLLTIFRWVSPGITMFRGSMPLLSAVTLPGIFCSAGSPVMQVCLSFVVLMGSPVSVLVTHHCVVTILGSSPVLVT